MKSKRGEGLISLLLGSTVLGLALISVVGLSLTVFARSLLELDLYRLARAHLYGNSRNFCRPSPLWPDRYRRMIQLRCSGTGIVEGQLNFEILGLAWKLQRKIDLRRGATR